MPTPDFFSTALDGSIKTLMADTPGALVVTLPTPNELKLAEPKVNLILSSPSLAFFLNSILNSLSSLSSSNSEVAKANANGSFSGTLVAPSASYFASAKAFFLSATTSEAVFLSSAVPDLPMAFCASLAAAKVALAFSAASFWVAALAVLSSSFLVANSFSSFVWSLYNSLFSLSFETLSLAFNTALSFSGSLILSSISPNLIPIIVFWVNSSSEAPILPSPGLPNK